MTASAAVPIALEPRRQAREVARIRSGPAHIRVEKGRLVEFCMDSQALANELIRLNGEVIQAIAANFAPSDRRQAVLDATHKVHAKAVAALNEWLTATDRYEHTAPIR